MALYSASLTVPLNTPAITPVTTDLVIPAGVLQNIKIVFPPGCARMTKIAIYDGATLVFPKTAAGYFCEDSFTVNIDCFMIFDASKTLTVKGWSPGTTYPHVITVHAEAKTSEEIAMTRTGYY